MGDGIGTSRAGPASGKRGGEGAACLEPLVWFLSHRFAEHVIDITEVGTNGGQPWRW